MVQSLSPTITDRNLVTFASQRVVTDKRWVASGLLDGGTPSRRERLLGAMARRIVPNREYMRLHYGDAGFKAYRRRLGQALGFLVRFARHPSELSDDLSIDRWMHSLYRQKVSPDSSGKSETSSPTPLAGRNP